MAADAEELKWKEGEYKQRLEAKNELESFLIQLNKSIKMSKDSHKKKIVDAIGKTMEWLENNPQAIGDEFGDQFGEHVNCLKKEWDGMLQRSPRPDTAMSANSDESGFAKLIDLARDLAKSSTESRSWSRNPRKTDVARQPIKTRTTQPDPQNVARQPINPSQSLVKDSFLPLEKQVGLGLTHLTCLIVKLSIKSYLLVQIPKRQISK